MSANRELEEKELINEYPITKQLGLRVFEDEEYPEDRVVMADALESKLRQAQVAFGFGHPGGSMTISTDLKDQGSCDLKALVLLPERLDKPETAADLLKIIIAVNGNLTKDEQLSHGKALGLRPEFIERCKRALGL